MFCGTLLGTRRWAGSADGVGAGTGLLRFDTDGSRDGVCCRCGYGELGNVRFLNVKGVVSAGPMLPTGLPESLMMRGEVRLNAAAGIVRLPGANGAEGRDEVDLFVEPVVGGRLPNADMYSLGVRKGDSKGLR